MEHITPRIARRSADAEELGYSHEKGEARGYLEPPSMNKSHNSGKSKRKKDSSNTGGSASKGKKEEGLIR